ncbi:hypothetical protein GCM10023231_23130 [Olivibacter ginsenosidimutans]|uniref:Uncharacterized protein n=2 Tax=Olivibacter ginsenosidimutans TaxID=1176537 RepID=A0ABP9BG98_9SPHI
MKKNAWNHKRIILTAALLTTVFSLFAQENSPAHIGIIYPLSTHGGKAEEYTNHLSLHAIAGLSGGERGLALYGGAGIIKGDAAGLQAAGLWNQVSGTLHGVQLAGVINLAQQANNGVQLAGVVNRSMGSTRAQLAGVSNIAYDANGLQAAGVGNLSGQVNGIQLAGVFNHATDVHGAQLAGVVNKAKQVTGIQLGVVNIADNSDYAIGLINLVKNGERSIGIETDEDLSTFVNFRSGGRVLYGILGIGFNPQYEQIRYGIQGGIGAKLLNTRNFRLAAEINSITLTDFDGHYFSKNGLRILPAIRIANNVYLYGGPSFNYVNTDNEDGKKLVKFELWDRQRKNDYQALNVGFMGGIQLML